MPDRHVSSGGNTQGLLVRPHAESVRVLTVSSDKAQIQHQMHLRAGTDCLLELPAGTGALTYTGTVTQCSSLYGRMPPYWYESTIAFRPAG